MKKNEDEIYKLLGFSIFRVNIHINGIPYLFQSRAHKLYRTETYSYEDMTEFVIANTPIFMFLVLLKS